MNVYISAVKERSNSARMYVTLLITPFVLAVVSQVAQNIAGQGAPKTGGSDFVFTAALVQTPLIVRWLFIVVGLAGVVPFQRFIDAHCQVYKMSRSMNNFRLLYRLMLDGTLQGYGWSLGLKTDPNFPSPVRWTHWATLFAVLMGLINCGFVWLGVATLDDSSWKLAAWVLTILYALGQALLYAHETKLIVNRSLPENKRYRTVSRSYAELRELCRENKLWHI